MSRFHLPSAPLLACLPVVLTAVALICVGGCDLSDTRAGLDVLPGDSDTTGNPQTKGPHVNHAPTLGLGVHNVSMLEGESKVILLRARDEDGDAVRFAIPNLDSLRALFPDGKKAIDIVTGGDSLRIFFQPGSAKGNYRFRIVVSDTAGGVEEQLLTISVGKVNHPPTVSFAAPATGTAFRISEGRTLSLKITATDPDGDAVSFQGLANPPWPRFGKGSYDTKTGVLTFTPSFQCVAAGETTFSDLVFKAVDKGSPAEAGQIAARITAVDSNSAPIWKSADVSLNGMEGREIALDLAGLYLGDEEKDAVSFAATCGAVDEAQRWAFTPGFRDAGPRECLITASDSHKPPATSTLKVILAIADSVRLVDVAILSPVSGFLTHDSVVAVEWMVGDMKQTTETEERLAVEGPNVIRRSFRDSLGNNGSDSVTIMRDSQGPLAPKVLVPGLLNVAVPHWLLRGGGGGSGHFRVRLDNADPAAAMAEWNDTVYVPSAPLAEGHHVLYAQEGDEAGNWSPVDSGAVLIDMTAPVVHILSPIAGSWTNAATVDVQWTLDGVPQTAQATENLAADGVLRIRREALDSAGNRGADSVLILRRSQAGAAPIVAGTPSPTRAAEWTWSSGGPGGAGVYRIGYAAGVWMDRLTEKRFAAPADIPEGAQTLFVSEADSAGNWSAAGSFAITIDRTPPAVNITGPVADAAITSADPAITGTLSEAVGPVTLGWTGTGIPAGKAVITGSTWSVASIAYPAGDVTVTLTPVDAAGNAGVPVAVTIHKRAGVLFVRKGGTGKGASWRDAYGELWQAVAARGSASELWVAEGEYPSAADGATALDIPSTLTVYGGFAPDGTGLTPADRAMADPKSVIRCDGPVAGYAVRMLGQTSVLDGFGITATGGGLQGDSDNIARNLRILGAGGAYPLHIVAADHGIAFRLEHSRIEGATKAEKAAVSLGAKAKLNLLDCAIIGNTATGAASGGGIWLDKQATLTATALTLTGNSVPDSAGTRALQVRVEDKGNAVIEGTVDGGAAGIELAPGGKAKLNGVDVP